MGMTPSSEWSFRQRNEFPWPARRGGTPRLTAGGAAGCCAVAMEIDAPKRLRVEAVSDRETEMLLHVSDALLVSRIAAVKEWGKLVRKAI